MLKIAFYLIASYLFILLYLYLIQRSLIYFPDQSFPSPAEVGVPQMEVVKLPTHDGLVLNAWYRPPIHSNLPTLVYFHGNAGSIGHRAIIVRPFLEEGFGVLLLTYRGYSGNPGKPSEQGLYMDARAAMQFLHQQGVKNDSIVLYGNSIGAAVAIQMATEYPVGVIVLQSPFTSLGDVGHIHYPFFPIKWLIKDKFASITKIGQMTIPVFILHGENDQIIPPLLSRRLFTALPGPKQAVYIPNKGHNDLYEPNLVIRFIQKNLPKSK